MTQRSDLQDQEGNRVKDRSADASYFIITPQIVWAKCKDPYDLALWTVIKMVAGDEGECYLSTEKLAALARMSVGQVSQSRKRLLETGLLQGTLQQGPDGGRPVWHLSIPDLRADNIAWGKAHPGLAEWMEWRKAESTASEVERPAGSDVLPGYEYDPRKHRPVRRWVTKTCTRCGKKFLRPSRWGRTQHCPECLAFSTEFIEQARKITRMLLDEQGWPTRCARCGDEATPLVAHHRIPLSRGGGPGLHNVEVLCENCHMKAHGSQPALQEKPNE